MVKKFPTMTVLGVGALAVGGFLVYKWLIGGGADSLLSQLGGAAGGIGGGALAPSGMPTSGSPTSTAPYWSEYTDQLYMQGQPRGMIPTAPEVVKLGEVGGVEFLAQFMGEGQRYPADIRAYPAIPTGERVEVRVGEAMLVPTERIKMSEKVIGTGITRTPNIIMRGEGVFPTGIGEPAGMQELGGSIFNSFTQKVKESKEEGIPEPIKSITAGLFAPAAFGVNLFTMISDPAGGFTPVAQQIEGWQTWAYQTGQGIGTTLGTRPSQPKRIPRVTRMATPSPQTPSGGGIMGRVRAIMQQATGRAVPSLIAPLTGTTSANIKSGVTFGG